MSEKHSACKHVETLLPWFVNGSLEAAERQNVTQHLSDCEPCKNELQEVHQAWDMFEQHLDMQALEHLARSDDPSTAQVAEHALHHYQGCESCQEQVALMKESWQALATAPEIFLPESKRIIKKPWQYWTGLGMAAALVMAMGLGWFMANRSMDPHGDAQMVVDQPQANLVTKDLFPEEWTRRSDSGSQVTLFEGFTGLSLTLHTQFATSPLTVQLQKLEGETLWEAASAIRQENGTVSVMIPAALLKTQSLVLVLKDENGQSEHYMIEPEVR